MPNPSQAAIKSIYYSKYIKLFSILESIAKNIRLFRTKQQLTQKRLAEILSDTYGLSVDHGIVSKIENGDRKVSADELLALSQIFRVTLDELFGLDTHSELATVKAELRACKAKLQEMVKFYQEVKAATVGYQPPLAD